jgi:hypothetical protein
VLESDEYAVLSLAAQTLGLLKIIIYPFAKPVFILIGKRTRQAY